MKYPAEVTLGLAIVIVVAGILWSCALHNPVNVEPDYPPPPSFGASQDAGKDG